MTYDPTSATARQLRADLRLARDRYHALLQNPTTDQDRWDAERACTAAMVAIQDHQTGEPVLPPAPIAQCFNDLCRQG
jgi:hypothetical protein